MKRRTHLILALIAMLFASMRAEPREILAQSTQPTTRPVALVYRWTGPCACNGAAEAVAAQLAKSKYNFDIEYVGPNEATKLDAAALARATVLAFPGGNGDVDDAYAAVRTMEPAIHHWIANGGRYLGYCLGAYLAGSNPGLSLLPGDTDQYIAAKDATVHTQRDTVVKVNWRGKARWMFFQDGCDVFVNKDEPVTVLATYTGGEIAAMVVPYGKGSIGITGPHPEADATWYTERNKNPDGPNQDDLGLDLIEATMRK